MKQLILLITIIVTNYCVCSENTPYQFKDVGINNSIGAIIPDDVVFTDEFNKQVFLKDFVQDKPTIINFVYLNCPLLCHLLLDGVVDVINRSNYAINKDYQIISISIDPKESNKNLKSYKNKYLDQFNINSGWFFLKGTQDNIQKLTEAFGYHYNYIKRTNDYAHPSVIFFYRKKLTNYIEGVTFEKNMFDYSIMSTKVDKTIKEKVVTYCYFFDPDNQTYSLYIMNIMRIACLITVMIIGIVIFKLTMKDKGQWKTFKV